MKRSASQPRSLSTVSNHHISQPISSNSNGSRSISTPRSRSRPASAKPAATQRAKQSALILKNYTTSNQLELTPVVRTTGLFGAYSGESRRIPTFTTNRITVTPNSKLHYFLQETQNRNEETTSKNMLSRKNAHSSALQRHGSASELRDQKTVIERISIIEKKDQQIAAAAQSQQAAVNNNEQQQKEEIAEEERKPSVKSLPSPTNRRLKLNLPESVPEPASAKEVADMPQDSVREPSARENPKDRELGVEERESPRPEEVVRISNRPDPPDTSRSSDKEVPDQQSENVKSYARISGSVLQVCGKLDPPGLVHLLKQNPTVDQVHFHKVHHSEFAIHKKALKPMMRQLAEALTLTHNNLETLQQMEELEDVFSGIKRLNISDNPIYTSLKRILKPFCICHFAGLLEFNGRSVQQQDRVNADKIFKKRLVVFENTENLKTCTPKSVATSNRYITSVVAHTFTIDKKMKIIDSEWDLFLHDLIKKSLSSYDTPESLQTHLEQFYEQLFDK